MSSLNNLLEKVDENVKKILLKYEKDFGEMGKKELHELFRLISEGNFSELDIYMQCQLLAALPDNDFLLLKKNNAEALQKMADLVVKKKEIVEDLVKVVAKEVAKELLLLLL